MGTEIQATDDEKHYVALKPLVEGIGLKWDGILRKVKNNKALSSTMYVTYTVAEDGKNREMVCLPLDRLNGLLFLINPEDYNHNPRLKERLVRYQEQCYDALYQYFNNGVAVHPVMAVQPQEVQMQAFQNAINAAVSNTLDMARAQMQLMNDEFRRTKAWISEKREATALQRNSVLQRRINKLEREKQDVIDDYDEQIEDLKDRLEPAAERYWDWRRKVGRPPKGYVRPEDDNRDYLF